MDANNQPLTCCTPEPSAPRRWRSRITGQRSCGRGIRSFAKAAAHPVRVRILRMLARKEARSCSVIVDELPLAQSTVSEHLRILKQAGLVRTNENGLRVGYCIVPSALKRFKALLDAI